LGVVIHNTISAEAALSFNKVKILATVFIRLVQMIIAPLVFTTLVVGIAKLEMLAQWVEWEEALGWFFTSLISLLLGMFFVMFLSRE
jgi:Na+/H+-dicarboxylate symporter